MRDTQIKIEFEGADSLIETWLGQDGSYHRDRLRAGRWTAEDAQRQIEALPHRFYSVTTVPLETADGILTDEELYRLYRDVAGVLREPEPSRVSFNMLKALQELKRLRAK
jgi:hypothetical protein